MKHGNKQRIVKKPKKRKIETSKLLAIYLFILFNAIIVYSMIAMWMFADLEYLNVLVTDIAAQVLVYMIYCMKAYFGKRQEEATKLKREKMIIDSDKNSDDTIYG